MEITHFERMSLNGLCSNSLILNRGQAFRGREGISLSVHACHHTFAYSLLFFSNSFFFLSKFSSPFSLFFLFPCGVVMFTLAFLSCCSILLVIFSVHGGWPFYTAYREEYLLFYPWTAFVWVWVSFQTTHWFVSCSATITYLCWPCHIPLPDKESYFVCLLIVSFLSK